jgi:hypothetical protein
VVSRSPAHHTFERTTGAAASPLPRNYQPRRPQATAFYRVIADHLETMLQDARERSPHGFGLPRHIEGSFRRFLDCGRVVCSSCRYEVLVPFSCKTRGLCPSCDGRRMADGAAHLVDRVLRFQPIASAIMLPIAAALIYAAVAVKRSHRRRAAEPATPMLILASGQLLAGDRRVLASLADVRVQTRFQLFSSSRALAVEWPGGGLVIARGNPFGDSIKGLQRALDAALKRAAG